MTTNYPPRRYEKPFEGCNWCAWVEESIREMQEEIDRLKRKIETLKKE